MLHRKKYMHMSVFQVIRILNILKYFQLTKSFFFQLIKIILSFSVLYLCMVKYFMRYAIFPFHKNNY